MITAKTFRFLSDLKKNNDRDWFLAHKDAFEAAKAEMEDMVTFLVNRIGAFDASVKGVDPRKCIFRIYRDVRFAKDKSPYKTHLGAHISGAAKAKDFHGSAGYYVHVEPGGCVLGGGAYMPSPVWLKAIRDAIERDGGSLKKIVTSASFKKFFGTLQGDALKRNAPGYRPDHLYMELLKHKDFLAMHDLKDKDVLAPGFPKHAEAVFKAMQPLNRFVNEAMEEA